MSENQINYYFISCKYFYSIYFFPYKENETIKGKPYCKKLKTILTEIEKDCSFCEIVKKARKIQERKIKEKSEKDIKEIFKYSNKLYKSCYGRKNNEKF